MPIYGDESGDVGMKPGSSPRFSLCVALFETVEQAADCSETIAQLKVELGEDEFHWIALGDKNRKAFLEGIAKEKFHYLVQTVEKQKLKQRNIRKKAFYDRVAEQMAKGVDEYLRLAQECCSPSHLNCLLVLDRNDDRDYMRAMEHHLRSIKDDDGHSLIGRIRAHRSNGENLLQLADMLCGAALHPPFDKLIADKAWSPHLKWA